MKIFFAVVISLLSTNAVFAQNLKPYETSIIQTKFQGKDAIKVVMDTIIKTFDEPTFAKLTDSNFHDGTIEVNVFSKFLRVLPIGHVDLSELPSG